jgi:putative phage-type endonuclease
MSTIMRLVQGSPEWHEHRRKYRNASETPAVLGVSPWCTPYQLWQQKLGLTQPEVNNAMLHGTQLEPAARAAYETRTGHVMQPLVLVDGEYSASLDGLTLRGDRILEVKCPYQGRASTLWEAASAGELPEHYWWQVQHQLLVAGAAIADVFVFDGTEGLLLEVQPTPESWVRIRSAWDAFAQHVAKAAPPPLTERDVRVRDDPEWLEAAAAYLEVKARYDGLGTAYDEAKARLIALATHPKEEGAGVTVTKFWRRGNIDYKRMPELADVNLERYRTAGREEVRVSVGDR